MSDTAIEKFVAKQEKDQDEINYLREEADKVQKRVFNRSKRHIKEVMTESPDDLETLLSLEKRVERYAQYDTTKEVNDQISYLMAQQIKDKRWWSHGRFQSGFYGFGEGIRINDGYIGLSLHGEDGDDENQISQIAEGMRHLIENYPNPDYDPKDTESGLFVFDIMEHTLSEFRTYRCIFREGEYILCGYRYHSFIEDKRWDNAEDAVRFIADKHWYQSDKPEHQNHEHDSERW